MPNTLKWCQRDCAVYECVIVKRKIVQPVHWSQTKSSWASASLGLRELRRRCPRASDESSLPGDKLSPPRGELYPPGGELYPPRGVLYPPGEEGCRLRVAGISCKAPLLGLQRLSSVFIVWCGMESTWQWCPGKLQVPNLSPPSPWPGTSGSQVCDLVQPEWWSSMKNSHARCLGEDEDEDNQLSSF